VANARQAGAKKLELVSSAQRRGKGDAIRRGLGRAKGKFVVIQDGDYEYRPSELPRLLKPLLVGEADITYGSRFRGTISGMALTHQAANRVLSLAASLLYLTPITDEATCYKAFRANWLSKIRLRAKGFDFCPEVTARLLKRGARYREVPVSYRGRTKQQGKKVRYRDGLVALWTLLKYRFVG
jgi:dolichol-phosphate mannosyltransferase